MIHTDLLVRQHTPHAHRTIRAGNQTHRATAQATARRPHQLLVIQFDFNQDLVSFPNSSLVCFSSASAALFSSCLMAGACLTAEAFRGMRMRRPEHRGGRLTVLAAQPCGCLVPAASDRRALLHQIPQSHLLGSERHRRRFDLNGGRLPGFLLTHRRPRIGSKRRTGHPWRTIPYRRTKSCDAGR